jgi:UDP-N-acetylglucosamine 1-carboxyvinyltransferase
MLTIAAELGADIKHDSREKRVSITARDLQTTELPPTLCAEIRAGVLFAAPLLLRTGRALMSPPGGDVIGRRRLDAHFIGLKAMGAEMTVGGRFEFRAARGLHGSQIFLPEASVTGTEHLLMAAVLADGQTVIQNGACEPHVQDLARMLCAMGAEISGIGTNTLIINGVKKLHGVHHRVSSDYTEVGSFLALAAATGGEITVTDIDPTHYLMTRHVFARLGMQLEFNGDQVHMPALDSRRIEPDPRGGIPVIDDGPWPQFASDLMSVAIVLATQLSGTVLFFEKMYESRMYFVDRLIAMGANAVICDPHRVVVAGPARLHGIELSSPDIRAGIALLGAALCATGESCVRSVHLIDRGYERIEDKLNALGARIERVRQG